MKKQKHTRQMTATRRKANRVGDIRSTLRWGCMKRPGKDGRQQSWREGDRQRTQQTEGKFE